MKRMNPFRTLLDGADRILTCAYTLAMRQVVRCVGAAFSAWSGAPSSSSRSLIHVGGDVVLGEYAWLNAKDERRDACRR